MMNHSPLSPEQGCLNIVGNCAMLQPGEKAIIVSDTRTRPIGELVEKAARSISSAVMHETIPPGTTHGEEPPSRIASLMRQSHVIFGMTGMSMAHTLARQEATSAGARYLSMPDYTLAMLSRPALHVDFHALTPVAEAVGRSMSQAATLTVSSAAGTNLSVQIKGRMANICPGWCNGPGTLASPPDAETNVAPLEYSACGVLVVDGSIPFPGLGVLDAPVTFEINRGRIVSGHGKRYADIMNVLTQDPTGNSLLLAEVGVGLNPAASLCGSMLEDEGALGTVHFGFGSNHTIGGTIKASQHIDMIIKNPTLKADETIVVESGTIRVE